MSLNRQLVFDTVREHLLKQDKKATNGPLCMYRAPDGCKCAIGALIPDEKYSKSFEAHGVALVSILRALDPKFGNPDFTITIRNTGEEYGYGGDVEFLGILQNIHDGYQPEGWIRQLEFFARTYQLSERPDQAMDQPHHGHDDPFDTLSQQHATYTNDLPNGQAIAVDIETKDGAIVKVSDHNTGKDWQLWEKAKLPRKAPEAFRKLDPTHWIDKQGLGHVAQAFGKNWKFQEDVDLVMAWRSGLPEEVLATVFNRHPDAVVRRLGAIAALQPIGPEPRFYQMTPGMWIPVMFASEEIMIKYLRASLFGPIRKTSKLAFTQEQVDNWPMPRPQRFWHVLKAAIAAVPEVKF